MLSSNNLWKLLLLNYYLTVILNNFYDVCSDKLWILNFKTLTTLLFYHYFFSLFIIILKL